MAGERAGHEDKGPQAPPGPADWLPFPSRRLPRPIRLAGRCTLAAVHYARQAWRSRGATIHPAPVFVLGNQKCGTTVIAALLGARTGQAVSLDLRFEIAWPTAHRVYAGELPFDKFLRLHRLDFSRPIVKEPSLTLLFPQLAQRFPQSQFIFVVRDPRDNIRSILDRLDLPGNLPDLGRADRRRLSRGWDVIFAGRGLGLEGENYVDLLAARWNRMVDIYLEHRARFTLMRYEDFLRDKTAAIDGLVAAVGLQPVQDIADKTDMPYQRRGRSETDWTEFFGPGRLARINVLCGERMRQVGYPLPAGSATAAGGR